MRYHRAHDRISERHTAVPYRAVLRTLRLRNSDLSWFEAYQSALQLNALDWFDAEARSMGAIFMRLGIFELCASLRFLPPIDLIADLMRSLQIYRTFSEIATLSIDDFANLSAAIAFWRQADDKSRGFLIVNLGNLVSADADDFPLFLNALRTFWSLVESLHGGGERYELIMDIYPVHITESVRHHAARVDFTVHFIPSGLTD
jgi:hypothetical protein